MSVKPLELFASSWMVLTHFVSKNQYCPKFDCINSSKNELELHQSYLDKETFV